MLVYLYHTKTNDMTTIKEVTEYLSQEGTQIIENEAANYMFVKRSDGVLLQYTDGEYKFYKTLNGLAKAALYKIKRG